MKLLVVVPAYNAARHVGDVLSRLDALGLPQLQRIVVVNDGSTDDTQAVVQRQLSLNTPITLFNRTKNGGYGAAMKDGLRLALEFTPDAIACVHADAQYSPEALPRLLGELAAAKWDLLQGSRIASGTALTGGMPRYKYLANFVLNRLENLTLGLGLSDYHSGYLLYGRRVLDQIPFARLSDRFDFDLEVIASARAHGLLVGEAPVRTHYGDEISYLNPLTYGLRVLGVLLRYRQGHYDPISS